MRWIALTLLAGVALLAALAALDLRAAYRRLEVPVETFADAVGTIGFHQGGDGIPVLVVHGSGGGWDQGELLARALLGDRVRWIAPSRFGYPGSSLPPGASFDDQADAYARLLDHLRLPRVAVVALSHGGPSALLFALRHPERVSSLTLLSCGVASFDDPGQAQANQRGDALTTVFSHDLLYWGLSRFGRRPLLRLMGADAALVAALPAAQRELVDAVIDGMNPVAPRAAGVAFDHGAAMPGARIAAIRAPTLVVHAVDDGLQRFANAELALAHIEGAQLLRFERGGHLVIAVEQPAVAAAVQAFVQAHAAR